MKKIFIIVVIFSSVVFGFEVPAFEKFANPNLKKYCTECHFVYQAEFLPKRSWQKMFEDKELKNHFGKRVVIYDFVKKQFLKYYLENASDAKNTKITRKINRSIPENKTYLRVSKVPYIWSKHEDLDKEMFIENPKVKSYGNCKACHQADKGQYDEDDAKVPNWSKSFLFGWSQD
jgi:nitrate/TMAO reductase-like tetraheme cytochrome c subunit